MAYQVWDVVAFEQPTSSKWNILGDNDAFFNDQIGANFSAGTTSTVWLEEIGRQTLGSAGDTVTVSALPARKHLVVFATFIDTGGTINVSARFNSDTGSNYSARGSTGGAADVTASSATSIGLSETGAFPHFVIMEIMNISAEEKVFYARVTTPGTAGAGNLPGRVEASGKWVNTSSQISSISLFNAGTGDFAIGSSAVVLGHD